MSPGLLPFLDDSPPRLPLLLLELELPLELPPLLPLLLPRDLDPLPLLPLEPFPLDDELRKKESPVNEEEDGGVTGVFWKNELPVNDVGDATDELIGNAGNAGRVGLDIDPIPRRRSAWRKAESPRTGSKTDFLPPPCFLLRRRRSWRTTR